MKPIILLIALLFYTDMVIAQDEIILANGDIVPATVKEVGIEDVKYVKWDNPNGPMYVIRKSDIFMIKYSNGSKEVLGSRDIKNDEQVIPEGTATLYFYRLRKLSGAATKIIVGTVDPDEVITKLSNGAWVKQPYTHPGNRQFVAGVYSINPKTFDYAIEPGKTYYIRCSLLAQGFKMMAKLELVNKETADKEMKDLEQQTRQL